jgi:hypothetical protein
VTLRHRAASEAEARALWAAVAADNPAYVTGTVTGDTLEIRVAAAGPRSVRQTVDDLLAALAAAERTARAGARRAPSTGP